MTTKAKANKALDAMEAGRPKESHERDGGWDEWELADGARHLERAEKIKANPKFLEAIRKHVEKKAEEHDRMAHRIKELEKGGHISPKAAEKMKKG